MLFTTFLVVFSREERKGEKRNLTSLFVGWSRKPKHTTLLQMWNFHFLMQDRSQPTVERIANATNTYVECRVRADALTFRKVCTKVARTDPNLDHCCQPKMGVALATVCKHSGQTEQPSAQCAQ